MVRCCCLSFSTHLVMLNFRLSKNSVLHFFSPRTTGMTCFSRQSCVQWWKWGWKWNRKCPARWPKAETPWSLGPISSPWLENPWCHEILWFGNAKPVFDGPKKAFFYTSQPPETPTRNQQVRPMSFTLLAFSSCQNWVKLKFFTQKYKTF